VGTASGVPFQHGCTGSSGGGSQPPPAFYKDVEGVVHIEGEYGGCAATGDIAFQLPPAYRPKDFQSFPLVVSTNGVVSIFPSSGNGVNAGNAGGVLCGEANCYINGITFRAGF
jgi:hypothetical protein